MLKLAPRWLPHLSLMLDDLGNPSAAAIARTLGVSETLTRRWIRSGDAPRAAQLALFWLTRWGRSEVDAKAVNDARLSHQTCEALRREVTLLREENARLLRLGDFGAANDPGLLQGQPSQGSDQRDQARCDPRRPIGRLTALAKPPAHQTIPVPNRAQRSLSVRPE